ncbi:MAG: hypothetical protein JO307_31230 [Bryobacterales bacterium]|nr:hypothetical protein [Bryobacterales bacterium]
MDLLFPWALIVGFDDAVVLALTISSVSAIASLATGLISYFKHGSHSKVTVKLPDGKTVTLSKSMSPKEIEDTLSTIKAEVASSEQDGLSQPE